jgi:hypothetical protein
MLLISSRYPPRNQPPELGHSEEAARVLQNRAVLSLFDDLLVLSPQGR